MQRAVWLGKEVTLQVAGGTGYCGQWQAERGPFPGTGHCDGGGGDPARAVDSISLYLCRQHLSLNLSLSLSLCRRQSLHCTTAFTLAVG